MGSINSELQNATLGRRVATVIICRSRLCSRGTNPSAGRRSEKTYAARSLLKVYIQNYGALPLCSLWPQPGG